MKNLKGPLLPCQRLRLKDEEERQDAFLVGLLAGPHCNWLFSWTVAQDIRFNGK